MVLYVGGGGGISWGARVEMGERGVCWGISLHCISVFPPVLFSTAARDPPPAEYK